MENTSGTEILSFTYSDGTDNGNPGNTHWPTQSDGSGESLVLIHPASGINLSDPLLWRASASNHGTPNGSDSSPLPADPTEDLDKDGSVALLENTFNSSDNDASDTPAFTTARQTLSDSQTYLTLTFTRNSMHATSIAVQTSTSLNGWNTDAVIVSRTIHNDGTENTHLSFPYSRR